MAPSDASESNPIRAVNSARAWPKSPLVGVVACVSVGIVLDRLLLDDHSFAAWPIALVCVFLVVLARNRGSRHFQSPLLAIALIALGASWHHRFWSEIAPDDVCRFDWRIPAPAWLRGTLCEVPEYFVTDPTSDFLNPITRLRLQVTSRNDGSRWQPASGRILLAVAADRRDLAMGQAVEVAGVLREFEPPRNPGESDMRAHWRAEGIRLRMNVDDSDGIVADPARPDDAWARHLGDARVASARLLSEGLDNQTAPIANALLLGRREQIDPAVNDAFLRTGTMHWLAISGTHMHALATLLGLGLLALRVGPKPSAIVVVVLVLGYTILVGARASVVRSAVMCVVVSLAILCNRPVRAANLLALAGLATLFINPTWLFDAGCQLSFLSVGTLIWIIPPIARRLGLAPDRTGGRDPISGGFPPIPESPSAALDRLERTLWPWWRRGLDRASGIAALSLVGSFVISAVNAPLTASRFHLISWLGVLLNVPLIALSLPTLAATGLALFGLLTRSFLGAWAASLCSWLLRLSVSIVRAGAARRTGYQFLAAPPEWWLVLFYASLLAFCWLCYRPRSRGWLRASLVGLSIMSALGVVLIARTNAPRTPRADILAVDHGLAVVVRSTTGKTLLYDCGRMRDTHVGRRVLAPALWRLGVRRLDHVVISHADTDHFSGLLDLIDRFQVQQVYVPPGFGATGPAEARAALAECSRRSIPIREIVDGDQIPLDPEISITALHPPRETPPQWPSNARSVVLELRSLGNSMLLTGDLEGSGLERLIESRPPSDTDVLVVPHHGGKTANPDELYQWSNPRALVVSQKRPLTTTQDPLEAQRLRGRGLWRTWESGAITASWEQEGIHMQAYLDANALVAATDWIGLPHSLSGWIAGLTFMLAGLALAIGFAVVEWGAWALVAPGRRGASATASGFDALWSTRTIQASDGARLVARFRAAQDPQAGVAILCHGFGEDSTAMLDRANFLLARGWSVLVTELRGRGQSGGAFCTFGPLEADDLRAWIDNLRKSNAAGPYVVWGRSMGAAIALRTAACDPRIAASILEAPYASLRSAVAGGLRRKRLPGFLARPLIARAGRIAGTPLDRPDPLSLAPRVAAGVLILIGMRDRVAPSAEAERLANAFPATPRLLRIANAGHQDVFECCDDSELGQISDFLAAAR